MTDVAIKTKGPDLAAREKAADLAEALDRASLALEEHQKTADEATWAKLEAAETAAHAAYDAYGHRVAMRNDGSMLSCPMCKAPILEDDYEAK